MLVPASGGDRRSHTSRKQRAYIGRSEVVMAHQGRQGLYGNDAAEWIARALRPLLLEAVDLNC